MLVYIGPYPKHRWYHNYLYKWFGYAPDQTKYIKIDRWDSWSADYTLAEIILPVLVQLKDEQQGAPFVDPEDVPEFLQPSHIVEGDSVDNTHFDRWEWVLDEMIYAFDCKVNKDGVFMRFEDRDEMRKEQDRISNGFRLFGKYYENLWD